MNDPDLSIEKHGIDLAEEIVELNLALRQILKNAAVSEYTITLPKEVKLWLINPEGWDQPLTEQEASAAFEAPPYWSFCWGSGKALAEILLQGKLDISGKTVLDFGSGSGIVAIAAAMANACQVTCCDNDPMAIKAARANAMANNITLDYLEDFYALQQPVDFLFAADVLYDPDNFSLLEKFKLMAKTVVIADSRVKNFNSQGFQQFHQVCCVTEPDLGENLDVHTVRFYRAG